MGRIFLGVQRAIVERCLGDLSAEIGEVVIAAPQKDFGNSRLVAHPQLPIELGSRGAIKVKPTSGSFAHQHKVVPGFWRENRFAGQRLIQRVPIEQEQPARTAMGAADPQAVGSRALRSIRATREKVPSDDPRVIRYPVP